MNKPTASPIERFIAAILRGSVEAERTDIPFELMASALVSGLGLTKFSDGEAFWYATDYYKCGDDDD